MADDFAQAVLSKAVAHVALAVGAEKAHKSVIESLADITQRYIQTIGTIAVEKAEAAGRTEINLFDITSTFREMPNEQVDWRGLRDFAFKDVRKADTIDGTNWYQPFQGAEDLPIFPAEKRQRRQFGQKLGEKKIETDGGNKYSEGKQENNRPSYLPVGLPSLPPAHTYKRTKVLAVNRPTDSKTLRKVKLKRKRLAQNSLHKFGAAPEKSLQVEQEQMQVNLSQVGECESSDGEAQLKSAAPLFHTKSKPIASYTSINKENKGNTLCARSEESQLNGMKKEDSGMKKEDMILEGFLNEAQEVD